MIALAAAFPGMALGQAIGITDLGRFGGSSNSANGVSGNGSVVVGTANDLLGRAWIWTMSSGMTALSVPPNTVGTTAHGVSADGRVVVGDIFSSPSNGLAYRWTQATGIVTLGGLNGGTSSGAAAVSGDGQVVVGSAVNPAAGGASQAFRWTQATGMVGLGTGTLASFALGTNNDGSVVVGRSDTGPGSFVAFRWTQASGMVSLGTNGALTSRANAVNGDGAVVVGETSNPFNAFRWTQAAGMVVLGAGRANAVSRDGNVVVGSGGTSARRWTQASGWQTVEDWLRSTGVKVTAATTSDATGVSDDGNVVVGTLLNKDAYIARGGNGMVTIQALQESLAATSSAPAQGAGLAGMVLNGAHSRPLAHRVEPGKSCFWTAGDLGIDNHSDRSGSFALAEIGGCHRLGDGVQGSLSVGRSKSNQDLVFGGSSNVTTTFVVAELLGNISGTSLWPSAALMYQSGDAVVRRGYPNAGASDFSGGQPGVKSVALRLRMDWEDAARLGGTSFTPYADVSLARTDIEAYTETGGGFPASFDKRSEKATELRLGSDAAYPLSSAAKLLGRLEAAHRAEGTGTSTSGTVIGLMSFSLPGQTNKRDWLRAGLGIEAKLGAGVVSAMLNATTQGPAPSYWLNAFYQIAF